MRIGELAKATGLSTSRIRYYEAEGLLSLVKRRGNGYRDYPPEAVLVLEIIDSAQRAGFSLERIRGLLPMGQGNWDHDELLLAFNMRISEIEQRQKQLRRSKMQLQIAIESIQNRPQGISCEDNKRRVLDLLRGTGVISPAKRRNAKTTV